MAYTPHVLCLDIMAVGHNVHPISGSGILSIQESEIPPLRIFLRNLISDVSEKSPQKSSFSCKVYNYCLNFPLCNTASALWKLGGCKITSKYDSLVQHNALCSFEDGAMLQFCPRNGRISSFSSVSTADLPRISGATGYFAVLPSTTVAMSCILPER